MKSFALLPIFPLPPSSTAMYHAGTGARPYNGCRCFNSPPLPGKRIRIGLRWVTNGPCTISIKVVSPFFSRKNVPCRRKSGNGCWVGRPSMWEQVSSEGVAWKHRGRLAWGDVEASACRDASRGGRSRQEAIGSKWIQKWIQKRKLNNAGGHRRQMDSKTEAK